MKIVLTATGEGLDSRLDPRFGRAPWFILVDTDSGDIQTVENSAGVEAEQGAGVQAAEVVSRLGAQCVVTGHCGPRAFRALQAAGIEVFTGASGTLAEAVEQLEAGALEKAHGPDVVGHWA